MNEPKKTLTIRLPESRINLIKEMAKAFGCSPSRLASVMLETGFVIVDGYRDGKGLKEMLNDVDI